MVIGMNLCPFARAALPGTKIIVASDVTDARSLREVIARELAVLADRLDVSEELTRLAAHVEHARELLAQDEPAGRSLDFLAQEFNREANTLGSKCNDAAVAHLVVELKGTIERLREQAQNIE